MFFNLAELAKSLDLKKIRVFIDQKVQQGEERRCRKTDDIVKIAFDFPDQESAESLSPSMSLHQLNIWIGCLT